MATSLREFRKFLLKYGLVRVRSKGGHEIWDYPDDSLPRPVTLQTHIKDVPEHIIKNNLRTIGCSYQEFEIATGKKSAPKLPKSE